MDNKVNSIIKEFERKIITRILLMRLNSKREWSNSLSIKGINMNNLKRINHIESIKQSLIVTSKPEEKKVNKKKKNKSRMAQWAEKMKSFEGQDASPQLPPLKTAELTKNITDDPSSRPSETKVIQKTLTNDPKEVNEELKEEATTEQPKYEIKLVFKHKFQSNISINSIDNLSILKNLEIINIKNWFVIKKNYKTFVFSLKDCNSERKEPLINVKSSSHSAIIETDRTSICGAILLEIYGISEPDESFLNDIVTTIKTQIDQINLIQRAKKIYRTKPTTLDFEFINEDPERMMVAFMLPSFIKDYLRFLANLKGKLVGTLVNIDLSATLKLETFVDQVYRENAKSVIKNSFHNNFYRSSLFAAKQGASSMIGEPSSAQLVETLDPHYNSSNKGVTIDEADNEIDESDANSSKLQKDITMTQEMFASCLENLEPPKDKEEAINQLEQMYQSENFTLVYNGF